MEIVMALNEANLIAKEVKIRNLRLPKEVLETRRSSVRWLALSLGILNPGESRHGAVPVLDALVYFYFIRKKDPEIVEILEYIGKNWGGIKEKTLRYHLLRMKKMGIVQNSGGRFYLRPPDVGDRDDPSVWVMSLLESDYREIASKITEIINNMRSKSMGEEHE
ncbi:hypothetical protein M1394_00585 [Candidatus Marsarchaeota archaeon]|nr:hypothetical protein [Candidatus Marsarchaeota archaeon]